MRLHILSDLHLEFAPFEPEPDAWRAADVVVLAGDIHPGVHGIEWAAQAFPDKPVLYVAGNHEFYGHHWTYLLGEMRETALACGVSLLEDDVVEIGGVRFLGCSLWTDFNLFGEDKRPLAMSATEQALMDYRQIKAEPLARVHSRRFTAHHTHQRHQRSRAWLEEQLASGNPARTVVITHHYPDRRSCPAGYAEDLVSAGFGSQLPPELLARASLWIHGHTHDSSDYALWHQDDEAFRETRVVANPRGYPLISGRFENPAFNPSLLVELFIPGGT